MCHTIMRASVVLSSRDQMKKFSQAKGERQSVCDAMNYRFWALKGHTAIVCVWVSVPYHIYIAHWRQFTWCDWFNIRFPDNEPYMIVMLLYGYIPTTIISMRPSPREYISGKQVKREVLVIVNCKCMWWWLKGV